MKHTTQIINAYLKGELEECELINFQEEVQSNEGLELKVSYELLKMMQEERAYRIDEMNNMNGGVMPIHRKISKGKAHNPTGYLLKLLQKK